MPAAAAACAMEIAPLTGRSSPFSPSSPTKAQSAVSQHSSPDALATASRMGRSKAGPDLRTSAGARLTVTLAVGKLRPQFLAAKRTRSLDSDTEASGRPTMSNDGKPRAVSASAFTS